MQIPPPPISKTGSSGTLFLGIFLLILWSGYLFLYYKSMTIYFYVLQWFINGAKEIKKLNYNQHVIYLSI